MSDLLIQPGIMESYPKTQVDLIRRTICQGATSDEMELYFYDCHRRGIHPLDKLIHFTKRAGKYTPITSIDFMRQRAAATEQYAGQDPPSFTGEGDERAATVTVYRLVKGQRYGWTATARWSEYYPGEQLGFMWDKMPHVMLEKCAEALALRKAFPAELAGLYSKEEMDQADMPKPQRPFAELYPQVKLPDSQLPAKEAEDYSQAFQKPELTKPGDGNLFEWYKIQILTAPNRKGGLQFYSDAAKDPYLNLDQRTVLGDTFNEKWTKK